MRKLKICLDTSVISHLYADDVPHRMSKTLELWAQIMRRYYSAVVSDLVLEELDRCAEPKKSMMLEKLAEIDYELAEVSSEMRDLANKYVDEEIFPSRYLDDALHVACASINGCNAVASWNFKHMVRLKTVLAVNGINKYMGYGDIEIVTPETIIGEDE
jgi:predicted nucleic acid-binding protein